MNFLEKDDHLSYRLGHLPLPIDRGGELGKLDGFSGTHLVFHDQHGWSFLIVYLAGRCSPDWNKYSILTPVTLMILRPAFARLFR